MVLAIPVEGQWGGMGWAACQLPLDLLRMKPVCAQELLRLTGVFQEAIGDGPFVGLFVFWTSAELEGDSGSLLDPSLVSFSQERRSQEAQKLQST